MMPISLIKVYYEVEEVASGSSISWISFGISVLSWSESQIVLVLPTPIQEPKTLAISLAILFHLVSTVYKMLHTLEESLHRIL